jgi:hypothetical protein
MFGERLDTSPAPRLVKRGWLIGGCVALLSLAALVTLGSRAATLRLVFGAMTLVEETKVTFDGRFPGVEVPDRLRVQFQVLKFRPRYDTPLQVDGDGIRQVLSFKGEHFPCFVPWGARFRVETLKLGLRYEPDPAP